MLLWSDMQMQAKLSRLLSPLGEKKSNRLKPLTGWRERMGDGGSMQMLGQDEDGEFCSNEGSLN